MPFAVATMLTLSLVSSPVLAKVPVRKEVVEEKVRGAHDLPAKRVESDVVIVQSTDGAPLGVTFDVADVDQVDTVEDWTVTTWNRRDWIWKRSPKELAATSGAMLGGGLLAIVLSAIAESDTQEQMNGKALLAAGGAVAVVGSPVPLVILGVRKAKTVDTVDSVRHEQRVIRSLAAPVGVRPFDGTIGIEVQQWSGDTVTGELPVSGGEAVLEQASIPFVADARQSHYWIQSVDGMAAHAPSDLAGRGWDGLHASYQAEMRKNPNANAVFRHSYGQWEAEQRRLEAENRRQHDAWLAMLAKRAEEYDAMREYDFDYQDMPGVDTSLGVDGAFGTRFMRATVGCAAEEGVDLLIESACQVTLTFFKVPVPQDAICAVAATTLGKYIRGDEWTFVDTVELTGAVLSGSDLVKDKIGPSGALQGAFNIAAFGVCVYGKM